MIPTRLAAVVCCAALVGTAFAANPPEQMRGVYNVMDYGAVGDAKTDDTAAFQKAIDDAFMNEGGVVFVPAGRFMIKGHLELRKAVTLEGIWRAPQEGGDLTKELEDRNLKERGKIGRQFFGSTLFAVEGKGDPDGPPFINMYNGSVIRGITIFYPEQVRENPPHAYPWTIGTRQFTTGCAIYNVTIINPYQAVDFGTYATGRHVIKGLYADALYKGLYVNQCYDVGRVEDTHFWPFFDLNPESPLWKFKWEKGTSYIIGRSDGEMMVNCFSYGYNIGIHFIAGPYLNDAEEIAGYAPGSGMFTNMYMDVTPNAVVVDDATRSAGVSFVNGSFMSGVVVGKDNKGPVKFIGCGFWAAPECSSHAKLDGRGTVTFEGCHFSGWDKKREGAYCIDANARRVIITGNDFETDRPDHNKVRLGNMVRAAVVSQNHMEGGQLIENNAPSYADVIIDDNVTEPPSMFVRKWILLGPFPNPKAPNEIEVMKDGKKVKERIMPNHIMTRPNYDKEFLEDLGGEANAILTEDTVVNFIMNNGTPATVDAEVAEAEPSGVLSFKRFYNMNGPLVYAFCYIKSDKDQVATIDYGTNDCGKLWINHELVAQRYNNNGDSSKPGDRRELVQLHKGLNPMLLKIEDAGGSMWEMRVEVYGEDGEPLKTKIKKGLFDKE